MYLESRTDLSILQALAQRLTHRAALALKCPFVYTIGNQPNEGRKHFDALLEAKPDLRGYLLVDSDAPELQGREALIEKKWERREIENYICQPETLENFAREFGRAQAEGPPSEQTGADRALDAMRGAIADRVAPAALRDRNDPWWRTVKASDEFLDLVFPEFFGRLGLRPDFPKSDYYRLVAHIPEELIPAEVRAVLDGIAMTADSARPADA